MQARDLLSTCYFQLVQPDPTAPDDILRQVDDLELDEPIVHRPWWRRLSVWMYIIPALLSAIVVAAAILMRIFNNVVCIWPLARPFEEPAE